MGLALHATSCRQAPSALPPAQSQQSHRRSFLCPLLTTPPRPAPAAEVYLINKTSSTVAAALQVGTPLVTEERCGGGGGEGVLACLFACCIVFAGIMPTGPWQAQDRRFNLRHH